MTRGPAPLHDPSESSGRLPGAESRPGVCAGPLCSNHAGPQFPLHTERAGLNHGQALLPLTVLDSKFLKGKGADVTVSRPWLVSGDSEHLARAAFYLILSIAL